MNKILTERKAGARLWRTPFSASILAGVIASWRRSKASQSAYSSSYTNAENAALFIIYENLAPEQIRTYRLSQLGLGRRIDKCQVVSGVGSHDIPCGESKWQIIFIAFVHDSKFCVSVEPHFFVSTEPESNCLFGLFHKFNWHWQWFILPRVRIALAGTQEIGGIVVEGALLGHFWLDFERVTLSWKYPLVTFVECIIFVEQKLIIKFKINPIAQRARNLGLDTHTLWGGSDLFTPDQ